MHHSIHFKTESQKQTYLNTGSLWFTNDEVFAFSRHHLYTTVTPWCRYEMTDTYSEYVSVALATAQVHHRMSLGDHCHCPHLWERPFSLSLLSFSFGFPVRNKKQNILNHPTLLFVVALAPKMRNSSQNYYTTMWYCIHKRVFFYTTNEI